jgi:3-methyl-2-oxobutanoate hydroxymethyltransferase
MMRSPSSLRDAKARGEKITALTAYDYPMARLLDEAGIDVILVGDSLGMVVLGYPDTTAVTVDDIVHHTRAAARGVQRALLVADLPARSYETPDAAVENGRRLIGAGAHAVKLEGGAVRRAQIAALTAAGIPVMGHIGMLPQIKGRSEAEIADLLADGRAVADAGAFAVVLEIVTAPAARRITDALEIPTIGIGSGAGCDGQILVTHDLLGLFPWFKPKFIAPRAQLAGTIREAVASYIQDTKGAAENH